MASNERDAARLSNAFSLAKTCSIGLKSGAVREGRGWINKHMDLRFDVPFGGSKQSEIGREQGEEGLKEFVDARVINLAKA